MDDINERIELVNVQAYKTETEHSSSTAGTMIEYRDHCLEEDSIAASSSTHNDSFAQELENYMLYGKTLEQLASYKSLVSETLDEEPEEGIEEHDKKQATPNNLENCRESLTRSSKSIKGDEEEVIYEKILDKIQILKDKFCGQEPEDSTHYVEEDIMQDIESMTNGL